MSMQLLSITLPDGTKIKPTDWTADYAGFRTGADMATKSSYTFSAKMRMDIDSYRRFRRTFCARRRRKPLPWWIVRDVILARGRRPKRWRAVLREITKTLPRDGFGVHEAVHRFHEVYRMNPKEM